MRCFDFNLLQPQKHWLTLISALREIRVGSLYFAFSLSLRLPVTHYPSFVLSQAEGRQVNGSMLVGGCVCVHDY